MSDNISEAINKLVKKNPDRCIVGTVKAVNGILCDVEPVDGTADLTGIRLCVEDTAAKFVIIPVVGSIVYVTMDSDTGGIVTGISEAEEIYLRGDAHGGLIKVSELVSKLNALENKVNSMIAIFNAHTHPYVNVVTPAVTSASSTTVSGTLTPTVRADIENTDVKHG